METGELMIWNVRANLRNYQDAPNFEASTRIVDETDRNTLSAILGSKFEHGLKHFPEGNSFLMQIFSANTNSSPRQPVNNFYHDKAGSSIQHAKSKFDSRAAKIIYVHSTFYPSATLPKSLQPPTEAMFIKMLRIVDIPADCFKQPTVMRFESLAYTCTVSKAKNGYASRSRMITDLSAQQLSSPSKDTTVCTLKSSTLTGFCDTSSFYNHTLVALPISICYHQNLSEFLIAINSFISNLKKILLVYGTSKREMIGFQMLSRSTWTSYLVYIDGMLSLASTTVATSCTAVSSSLSLQSCSTTLYMSTGIPLRIKKLLLQAIGDELITTTTMASMNDKEKIEVNSSSLFQCGYTFPSKRCPTSVVIPSMIPNQDYFERCYNIPLHLSCIRLHPEQFEALQLLPCSMQLQISTVSDIGMPKHCQNDLREEAVNRTPSPHFSRTSPARRSSTLNKNSLKRLVRKDRCGPLPKRCLYRSEHHYLYRKILWSQLRGKKMNRISLRKGLMPYTSTVHRSLKYQRTEMYSTESRRSLKQASVIRQPLEESRPLDRGVALFRGGKPSTQKSDTSSTSSEDDSDSDTDGGHSGAEASLQNPTSSHETSHSNGATNVQPFSDAPPPLIMSGGETDRYVRRSKSPTALVTKSSEQLLHSQGASSEPPRNKQVPHKSPSGSGGSQSSYIQKLECYENENIPQPIHCVCPQILEQAEEEVSMRLQHDNNADLAQPQVPSIENHPPQSASCSIQIPITDSITGSAILGFGANVEAASISSASALVNHEHQLAIVQQRLRGLVVEMRLQYDQISHLLRRSQNNLFNDQLQAIQLALRDIVREMRRIAHRWRVCELQFQHIRNLSLHTNIRDRLFELRQLRAHHACHSLLRLQPRLEQINGLLLELLSQLQQANARLAVAQAPQAPQANPQQAVMLPALLPGPGNVMPFQAQVEEDSPATHTDMH